MSLREFGETLLSCLQYAAIGLITILAITSIVALWIAAATYLYGKFTK